MDVNLTLTVPVAFPRHFEAWKEVSLWLLHRSLVAPRCGRFWRRFWPENSTLFRLRGKPCFVDKMAESRDRSSSTEPQLKFPGCSHYRRRSETYCRCQQCVWTRDWWFAHRRFLVMCARTGCPRRGKQRSRNANARQQRGQRRNRKKWTTPLNSMLQKKECIFVWNARYLNYNEGYKIWNRMVSAELLLLVWTYLKTKTFHRPTIMMFTNQMFCGTLLLKIKLTFDWDLGFIELIIC